MKEMKPQWPRAVPAPGMPVGQIHVWRAFLDITDRQRDGLLDLLSAEEAARAARFQFEQNRRRFIAARGVLRRLLGHYLSRSPEKIQLGYNAQGKPELPADTGADGLCFNLSHAGPVALYAVTRARAVGIDVERIRAEVDIGQIARHFFSLPEILVLESADESERQQLFFQYWTRKEALVKAAGKGLALPLDRFDISALAGRRWSSVSLPGEDCPPIKWYSKDIFPGSGYAAAIVVEGRIEELLCRHYEV